MAVPVRKGLIALAVETVLTLATAAVFVLLMPLFPPPEGVGGMAERLAFALRLTAWPAALVALMVAATSGARVLGDAFDPLTDAEPRLYRVNQRVLANTVEQMAIFLPAFLALATALPPGQLGLLRLAVWMFVGSRVLFWIGYLAHPLARAPGMTATYVVNAGLLLWLAALLAG